MRLTAFNTRIWINLVMGQIGSQRKRHGLETISQVSVQKGLQAKYEMNAQKMQVTFVSLWMLGPLKLYSYATRREYTL